VGAGKVLGGKRSQEREFPGKDCGTDDLSEFLRVCTRGSSAPGNAEQFQAFMLGLNAGPTTDRPDREGGERDGDRHRFR
jgi:hypothetical protein